MKTVGRLDVCPLLCLTPDARAKVSEQSSLDRVGNHSAETWMGKLFSLRNSLLCLPIVIIAR